LLYLICHFPLSLTGPYIFLRNVFTNKINYDPVMIELFFFAYFRTNTCLIRPGYRLINRWGFNR
jgi:hypothetical protein